MEDVRASGDDARGELCPADLRNILVREKGTAHLHDGSPGVTTFSCHLGASSEVHATECRLSATWKRTASPKRCRWAVHSQEVMFRSSLCVLVRRILGGSDGTGCSRGSSVDQERLVDAKVGQN